MAVPEPTIPTGPPPSANDGEANPSTATAAITKELAFITYHLLVEVTAKDLP
jgi:hypothetical protein